MELFNTPLKLGEKSKHVQKAGTFEKTSIVNIQLQQGETIAEHSVDADVIIIVRSGEVTFTVEGEAAQVTSETVLHMAPLEKHSLEARQASDIVVIQVKR